MQEVGGRRWVAQCLEDFLVTNDVCLYLTTVTVPQINACHV
jgi:hypothetical protein